MDNWGLLLFGPVRLPRSLPTPVTVEEADGMAGSDEVKYDSGWTW